MWSRSVEISCDMWWSRASARIRIQMSDKQNVMAHVNTNQRKWDANSIWHFQIILSLWIDTSLFSFSLAYQSSIRVPSAPTLESIHIYTCIQDSKHSSRKSSIINILLESASDKGCIRSLIVMLFIRPASYCGFAKCYRSDGGKANAFATRQCLWQNEKLAHRRLDTYEVERMSTGIFVRVSRSISFKLANFQQSFVGAPRSSQVILRIWGHPSFRPMLFTSPSD